MSNIEGITKTLIIQLLAHPDPKLRASAFAKKASNLSLEELASILNRICARATLKDPIYLWAYHCLPDLLLPWFSDRNKNLALLKMSRQKDYSKVLRLLIDFLAQETQGSKFAGEDLERKALTLGERKSLAKEHHLAKTFEGTAPGGHSSSPRESTAHRNGCFEDRLPAPNLTSAILREIYLDPKWTARYRVKKALICNPSCRPGLASIS